MSSPQWSHGLFTSFCVLYNKQFILFTIYFFPQQHTTPVTASVLVYHCYLGVNCESVKKRCGLPSAYYVIAGLPNRELISDAQPLFFFRPSCSSHCELPSWRRDNADLQLRDSPLLCLLGRVVSAVAPWL